METCDKCWREFKETIHTNDGIFRYCGLHAKELKESLEAENKDFY